MLATAVILFTICHGAFLQVNVFLLSAISVSSEGIVAGEQMDDNGYMIVLAPRNKVIVLKMRLSCMSTR